MLGNQEADINLDGAGITGQAVQWPAPRDAGVVPLGVGLRISEQGGVSPCGSFLGSRVGVVT